MVLLSRMVYKIDLILHTPNVFDPSDKINPIRRVLHTFFIRNKRQNWVFDHFLQAAKLKSLDNSQWEFLKCVK